MNRFADVILPLPLYKYFTYRIPGNMQGILRQGHRVVVPFGRSKYYTAIVAVLHDTEPEGYEVKEISTLLDEQPILLYPQIRFWEWIAEYYLCSVGDVYKAALPAGLKLESETSLTANPDYEGDAGERYTDREALLVAALSSQGRLTVHEIEKYTGLRNTLPVLRKLVERGAILVSERMRAAYKPKTETCVRLTFSQGDNDALRAAFDAVGRAKQQETLLLAFIDLSHFMQKGKYVEVPRAELLKRAGVSPAVLAGMVNKGVMEVYKREVSRFASSQRRLSPLPALSTEQERALGEIYGSLREKSVTLLHGVTSSGKTEIYIHLISNLLQQKRQVLYLVPEIALTTQLTERLQRVFGEQLLIYHSRFSDNERVEIWNSLLRDSEIRVVLGVRSSIFLPFKELGLVIVDEEHDGSYKQQEPAPRYNARNAAIMLATMFKAKTLLGSATPSVESYYNASTGKYALVALKSRYAGISLPKIEIADTGTLRRKKMMDGEISPRLAEEAKRALDAGGQVILFRNRRGFAPVVECRDCAWVPKCRDCDVSLTYHKRTGQLTCHYCGYSEPMPARCPACGSIHLEGIGAGTEHIEEEAAVKFPGYAISRMDLDTTRSRKAYMEIIEDFEKRRSQILIGTQMVTKGLDFGGVRVVGILGADTMLNFPDFRADERSFQLMEQVAGRAGRQGAQGTVVIQTARPSHPIIEQVARHDYEAMYAMQVAERRAYGYPPFSRLIDVYLKGGDEAVTDRAARLYAARLRGIFGTRVLGPDVPAVSRIQTMFIRKILIKTETTAAISGVKEILRREQETFSSTKEFRGISIYYDVDPM